MKTKTIDEKLSVPAAVRALRQSLGESQQQFAYRMKTAIRTIARYETTRPPKGKVLAHLQQIAADNGRDNLAGVFARALAEELQAPPFSGFHLDVAAKSKMEEFYESVILSMLRNPQYQPLLKRFNKLAAAPIAECARQIRTAEESRSKWQPFFESARKAGILKENE